MHNHKKYTWHCIKENNKVGIYYFINIMNTLLSPKAKAVALLLFLAPYIQWCGDALSWHNGYGWNNDASKSEEKYLPPSIDNWIKQLEAKWDTTWTRNMSSTPWF